MSFSAHVKKVKARARKQRNGCYLLAFALHPADATQHDTLYVGGYGHNDSHPTRTDAIYTWLVPHDKARLLTLDEVVLILEHKANCLYTIVVPQVNVPLLPAHTSNAYGYENEWAAAA